MKTYEISNLLKSDLLIVELPEFAFYEVFKHGIYIKDDYGERDFIEGSYTLLGSPDEISEEDAEQLVESLPDYVDIEWYKDYTVIDNEMHDGFAFLTAKESLLSAIETKIYWENPIEEPIMHQLLGPTENENSEEKAFVAGDERGTKEIPLNAEQYYQQTFKSEQ